MRIAVVTFFDNGNYGSELQSLAMNGYLKNCGHQPFFCKIRYSNKYLRAIEMRWNLCCLKFHCCFDKELKDYLNDRQHNFEKQKNISLDLKFRIHSFVSSYLEEAILSPSYISSKYKYDVFICGSDQIWSALRLPIQPMSFLYGVNKNRKIAYAPSMGLDVLPDYFIKQVKKYICDFKYLSVREDAAKKAIFDNYGIDAKQVLDPTILVGREYWDRLLEKHLKQKPQENYVFCYFLGEIESDVKTSIEKIASGKKVIMLPYEEECKTVSNGQFVLADPLDFLNLIKFADFVFTDSFHGSVFSVLYDKQFVVTKRTHIGKVAQTSRILSLLNLFGLENRYCTGADEIVKVCNETIDYNKIHPLVIAQQEASRNFLDGALLEIKNIIKKHE